MSLVNRKPLSILGWVVSCFIVLATINIAHAASSKGREFFLSFQPNLSTGANDNVALFISSEVNASGVVEIPGLSFSQSFETEPFQTLRVDLPSSARNLPANQVSNFGVRVTSNADVTVYGLNQYRFTTDAFLALPIDTLGSDYYVMSYTRLLQSQAAIVGVYDGTEVTTSSGASFTLNSNEAYLLTGADLTGTRIESSAPVAVFGGNRCVNIPVGTAFCDHTVEMIPPVATLGNTFLTVPLATRRRGDVFRVLASQDQTDVRINGELVSTLQSGEYFETVLTQRSVINTSEPALVAQYSPGQNFDGVISDPFMMLVPPSEQFLNTYTFSALEEALGFVNNFVNVVAPTADITSIVLDGEPVDTALFSPINDSGFSGAQIPISEGSHTILSPTPFGIYSYGFGSFDSYGYPGGMNFDLINNSGDQYAPNLRLITMDNVVEGIAGDSEDLNLNDFLDVGEDLNGNAIIDRRTEDINRNGILDEGEDTNNDGILDRDSGIFRIELAEGAQNLELTLDNFIPGSPRAQFRVTVIDPALPSSGTLVVTDGAGNTASEDISFSDEVLLQNVRVISTLSTTDIDLDESSFTQAPTSIDIQDTQTVIEWAFPTISIGQIEDLDYDIILRNPVASERRLVTHNLELYFDDVNGEQVYRALGQQFVNVLPSIFTIEVATDRQDYTVDQTVSIDTQLANLSQFDTTSSVEITILDSNGNLVATVGTFPSLALAANEMANLDMTQFNVGNSYVGSYIVRATLLNANGDIEAQADAQFNIVTPTDSQYAARITTDKPSYNPNETVTVQDRISNPAPNAVLSNATAITTITAPDGSEFWRQERTVPEIAAEGLFDIFHTVEIESASPGEYTARLAVFDSEGVERASSEVTFTVNSTQETGAGLIGLIEVMPSPVLKTENFELNVSVTNEGNSVIENVPATLSVVNIETQQVLQEWSLGDISLSVGEALSVTQTWWANTDIGNQYAAVLNVTIGGEEQLLASQSISVSEKLLTSLAVAGKGRLLVLLDDTGSLSQSCSGLSQLELAFRPDVVLLPQDQVQLELYDELGLLLDSEALTLNNFVGVVNQNLATLTDMALTNASADHVTVRLQSGQQDQALVDQAHRLVITHTQAGQNFTYDSGLFATTCDVLEGTQLVQGIEITARLGVDEADPYGPDGASTKLTQRNFLQSLLDSAGWSYTLVDNMDDYASELRTGGYAVSALFNEQLKLSEAVQDELVQAVNNGLGLLYAGFHDKRNGRIEPALGIKASGKLTGITGLELFSSVLQETPANLSFNFDAKPISADLVGANTLAVYSASGSISEPAITDYQYGQGQSVYMGFDALVQAASAGADSLFADLILSALDHVHPDTLPVLVGRVLPITLDLENVGTTVTGQVTLTLPDNITVIDSGHGRLTVDNTLLWPFLATMNELQQWTFWLQLPDVSGSASLSGDIEIATDNGQLIHYGLIQLNLNVTAE